MVKLLDWYKLAIISFLIINPFVFFPIDHLLRAGCWWLSLFSPSLWLSNATLFNRVVYYYSRSRHWYDQTRNGLSLELQANLPVLLYSYSWLLAFTHERTAFVHFHEDLLLGIQFANLYFVAFCVAAAFLSAFLDVH
ncbi:hypothetical protein O9993_14200 [Vibrio lentus]|nr:hypothetical protein [Vibrio lentus]